MYFSSINRFTPKPCLRSHNPELIVQDLSIGIPLNIFSNIYTNLHYGLDITTSAKHSVMYIKIYAKLCLYFLIIHYCAGSRCPRRFITG